MIIDTTNTHTEEGARDRWCPFARGWDDQGGGGNRALGGAADPDCKCLTTECMAWRWLHADERTSSDLGYCALMSRGARP